MSYPVPTAPSGVDEDAWADAVAKVRGYCGWHIAPVVTEDIVLDGPGGPVVALPTLRLVDLVSITDDGSAVTDPEWSRSGIVRRYHWTHKYRGITATIEHGYDAWPDDLTQATLELVNAPTTARVSSVTSGTHQVSFATSAETPTSDTLDRYRLPFVP